MTNIGPTIVGRTPCVPCNRDPENYVRAARYRSLQLVGPDTIDPEALSSIKQFVRNWCLENLRIEGGPPPFEEWLEDRPYSLNRKKELAMAHDRAMVNTGLPHHYIRSFLKSECYSAYKDPRLINSRCDEFKSIFGPWCKWMEGFVYELPMFAKHIRVTDRPGVIQDMLAHYPVQFVSDFSRFESSMRPEIMEAIEFEVYRYFGLPKKFMDTLAGKNHLCGRRGTFEAWVSGTRMSGEMNTSLGNGLTNWLIFAYWANEMGVDLVGMVEGDDGIFGTTIKPDPAYFLKLGFKIEFIFDKPVGEAGFCSSYWTRDGTTVTDLYRFVKLGWSFHLPVHASLRKKQELFGAICLSLGYEVGGSPIYWALAKKYGRPGRVPLDWWEHNEAEVLGIAHEIHGKFLHLMGKVPWKQPSMETREEYAQMFGLSVGAQLDIERQILEGNWFIDNAELNFLIDQTYPDLSDMHDRFVQWL